MDDPDKPKKDWSAKLRYQARERGQPELPADGGELPLSDRVFDRPSPFPVGPRAPVPGAHWYPIGPTNLGGRVRALAIHPSNDLILYAGAATGGVFKTTDGGETWTPQFHSEQSLSIASIAVAPSDPDVVFVATGEPNTGPVCHGAGIFRFKPAEGWKQIATGESMGNSFQFERILVHPTDPNQVWVVGHRGVFRSVDANGATPSFSQFDAGVYYSDAAFGGAPGGGGGQFLYLCRARTQRGEIVRIETPGGNNGAITTALGNRNNVALTLPARAPATIPDDPNTEEVVTLRGKLAVCRTRPEFVYAAFSENDRSHDNRGDDSGLRAVVRCGEANGRGAGNFHLTVWTPLPYRSTPDPNDFLLQDFGWYMQTIGVSPTNPDHVFFGMVTLYFTTTGTTTADWHPAMTSRLFRFDYRHHSDHHAIVFESTGATPAVWIGNDGGLVRCANYAAVNAFEPDLRVAAPPPLGVDFLDETRSLLPAFANPNGIAIEWRRRSDGLVAAQQYDLTQSQLMPSLYGAGLQDWGCWYTAGGDAWHKVIGADGGFVAWDPVDPYKFLVTNQGVIATLHAPGAWMTSIPPPEINVSSFLRPRELGGFHRLDPSRFVADTIYHPRRPGRIVTTRDGRAYATDDGETFNALPVGDVVDIIATHTHPQPTPFDLSNLRHNGVLVLEITGGAAADKLGFFRCVALSSKNETGNPRRADIPPNPTAATRPSATNITSLRTPLRGPYALADNDTLVFAVRFRDRTGTEADRTPLTVTFRAGQFVDITRATAHEVAQAINAAFSAPVFTSATQRVTIESKATFHAAPGMVELMTTATGPTAELTIGGTQRALDALRVAAGIYRGIAGRPAAVSLQCTRLEDPQFPAHDLEVGLVAADTLTIKVGAGPLRTITFAAAQFANLEAIRAEELAKAIQEQLDAAPAQAARALATTIRKFAVVLRTDNTFTPVAPRAAASTALPLLTTGNVPPGIAHIGNARAGESPEHEIRFKPQKLWNAYNLQNNPALKLRLTGAAGNFDVTFDNTPVSPAIAPAAAPPAFASLGRATVESAIAKIRAQLAANAKLRCEMALRVPTGDPSELAYDNSEPAHLWVGTEDGRVFLSPDDGVTWSSVGDPRMTLGGRAVEAIAIRPDRPETVYVGLGDRGEKPSSDETLWMTTNRGGQWVPVAAADLREVFPQPPPQTPRSLAINEIVIDPETPDRMWVATAAGVFQSVNAGANFAPLSEGLPNCKIIDVTYVPGRHMLRCAVWGRGTWARDVGPAAPPAVGLYLRTSMLDDGAVRPTDDGPDVFSPFPVQVARWESPDIKVSRLAYADLGATVEQVDTAEFDTVLTGEPVGEGAAAANDAYRVWVQVHNRSGNPAGDTRVIVLFADCQDGVPDLPDSLWSTIGNGTPTAGGAWTLIGVATIAGELTARRPRVARLAWTPPADLGHTTRQVGILALVSSAQDPLTTGPVSVRALLDSERRAALRLVPTRTVRDTSQIVLRALDGVPFQVTESGPATFGFPAAAGINARSGNVATFDAAANATRQLVIQTQPPPPGIARTVTVRFRPADLQAIGAAPAACTAADARRLIEQELRLGPVGVHVVDEGSRLSVRAERAVADVIAAPAALPDPAAELKSGAWITRASLTRSTTNRVYARIRNPGGIAEPALTWRVSWFDPTAAPIVFDNAHQLGTAQVAIAPDGELVVDVPFDPGAATGVRGILVTASSDGDPLRGIPANTTFADVMALDAYCARHPNAGYRILEVS